MTLAFSLTASDGWTMLAGMLVGVSCALPGCYLVLRRLSLLGDAISHAVLPGLAIAFILTSSREPGPMLIGALAVGVLTTGLTSFLHRAGRVPEDASMGVVFSSLFALGVLLITWAAHSVDLDPGCVLYGQLEFISLDRIRLAGLHVPRAVVWLSVLLVANVAFIRLFSKELRIVAFDAALATSMGISAAFVHYALMTLVAATCVTAFESVGSVLVVTMLVAPAATAQLLTDRLDRMLLLAGLLGAAAGAIGYLGAVLFNTSAAGMIAVTGGVQFALALFFAPRHGLVARQFNRAALSVRVASEDVLAALYRRAESGLPPAFPGALGTGPAGPLLRRAALVILRRRGLVRHEADGYSLTPAGHDHAAQVVRAHRLWESFLARETNLPLDHLHEASHRVEHFLDRPLADRLSEAVRTPTDPHGRPIPPAP